MQRTTTAMRDAFTAARIKPHFIGTSLCNRLINGLRSKAGTFNTGRGWSVNAGLHAGIAAVR